MTQTKPNRHLWHSLLCALIFLIGAFFMLGASAKAAEPTDDSTEIHTPVEPGEIPEDAPFDSFDTVTADLTTEFYPAVSWSQTQNPLTPDGTGNVLDNVSSSDGKEFFTIRAADGNVFYLIIDRERGANNVYFLTAVSESDLASLAKKSENAGTSGITTPNPEVPTAEQTPTTPAEQDPYTPAEKGGNSGAIIFVVIALLAVGVGAYYIKVIKPKKKHVSSDDDEDEDDVDDDSDDEFEIDEGGDTDNSTDDTEPFIKETESGETGETDSDNPKEK